MSISAWKKRRKCPCKETYPLLKECKDINFIGSIEARDIPAGARRHCHRGLCGNVILKLYEGLGATKIKAIDFQDKGRHDGFSSRKAGALLVKPALKKTLKSFDASEYGGAPLLGLKGLVVKCHGNSKEKEFKNSIIQCISFKEQHISERIGENLTVAQEKKEEV